MKKVIMVLPFILLGCKLNASVVSSPNNETVNKAIEILYQVTESDVAATLKYLSSDELEGTDPILKKEFLLISAHYDHIGLAREGVNGDFINNGANDDASGTTA